MALKLRFVITISALVVIVLTGAISGCRQPNSTTAVTLGYLHTGWLPAKEQHAFEILSRQFYGETGIKFRDLNGVQEETLDQLTLTRRLLHQNSSGPDLLEIDVTWLGVLQNDLADLRQYLAPGTYALNPGLSSSYAVDGKVFAIPLNVNGGILAYRSDLLKKYGYQNPPRTWQELETMAARIQEGERRKGNKKIWGYVWPGAAAESLTCNALEWQMSDGGGSVIEENHTISVNNPAAIRAWERARHWIGWISPPSITSYKENDVHDALDSGRAAFARVWGGEFGQSLRSGGPLRLRYAGDHLSIDNVRFTTIPAGTFASVAVLGGSGLAISRYSQHPHEDAMLLNFLLRASAGFTQDGVTPDPTREAVEYDFAPPLGTSIEAKPAESSFMVNRPSTISAGSYDKVTSAYFRAVHSVLIGERPAPQAAAGLAKDLVEITGFREGPVPHD